MRRMKQLFLIVGLIALLPACWNDQKQGKKTGLVVVNVLEQELFDDCHIKGSMNIPFEKIDELADTIDKGAQVVIYCSNYQCTSSEFVAKQMRSQGFSDVSVYEAGMAEWYQKGLPVEGDCKKAYLKKTCSKFAEDDVSEIPVISTQELAKKMQVIS